MRDIDKGAEPPSLTECRRSPDPTMENYQHKQELRERLVDEQRGLCCYCQARIRATGEAMRIEHWQSVSKYPEKQLDYRNLLGACPGGGNVPREERHCDTHKGDLELHRLHPADPDRPVEPHILFSADGRISSDDPEVEQELCDVLNLNTPRLVAYRQKLLASLDEGAQARRRMGKPRRNPERELRKHDGSQPGQLPPYSQVAVHWLQKKMRRTP